MVTNYWGALILSIALLLSLRDIYGHSDEEHEEDAFREEFGDDEKVDDNGEDEVRVRQEATHFKPPPHTTKKLPGMKFLFCVSCGYRQAYDEFSRHIHEKYPSMQIEGSNFAPATWKSIVAQVIGFGKFAAIVMIIMGQDPFANTGRPTPRIVSWALSNKLSSCMMLFLLSNTVESSLMSTGAFEIFLGDQQIWSKLESGRVPSPAELISIIDQQMELRGIKVAETFTFDSH